MCVSSKFLCCISFVDEIPTGPFLYMKHFHAEFKDMRGACQQPFLGGNIFLAQGYRKTHKDSTKVVLCCIMNWKT